VLTPHLAVGPEAEFPVMAPGRIVTKVVRIPVGGAGPPPTSALALRALTEPQVLDDAADALLVESIDVIAYASTTSAYAVGFCGEAAMVSRLSRRVGVPVVATCASAVLALRVLNVQRVALVHPPWFDYEANELGASYFRSQEFAVVMSAAAELAQDPSLIEPRAIVGWAARHVGHDAEAVFIGGNGFHAAGAIEVLEAAIGRPVLESNQVLLWSPLANVDATIEIRGYGRLFAHAPLEGAA